MAKPANAYHRNKITSLRRRVAQCAECGYPRTQQRRSVSRRQIVRYPHQPARLCKHHFRIPTITVNPGELLIFAIHQIAIAAEVTVATRAVEESNSNALSNIPALHFGADSIDPADGLVARHSGEGYW